MSTPENRYYLRSCDQLSSGESTPDSVSSQDSSLNLSDLEATVLTGQISELQQAPIQQNNNHSADMAAGFHITMPPFHGNSGERADEWLTWFNNFADAHNFNEDKRRQTMPFYLKDHALAWYNSQPADTKADLRALTAAMTDRFNGSDGLDSDMALLTLSQQPSESCASYFTRILKVTSNKNYPESLLTGIALKGLTVDIKTIVMPQNHKTLEDLRKAAMLAEKTVLATSATTAAVNVEDITKRVLEAVTDKLTEVMAFGRDRSDEHRPPPQTWSRQRQEYRSGDSRTARQAQMPRSGQQEKVCRGCGGKTFHNQKECGAYGVTCSYCGKRNHFTETCELKKLHERQNRQ